MSGALATARTPSQQARRQRLLISAQRLLRERDYEQIQIREVAEDAGVALGTLYRYFPSKDILYAHALLDWSESFAERVGKRPQAEQTDAARLKAALHAAVRAYERAPTFFRLLTVLEVDTDPVVRDVFATFSARFGDVLRAALPDTDPDDAATIAFLVSSALGSGLRSWAQQGTPIREVLARLDASVELLLDRGSGH